jgi:hypothetical protein
VGGVTFVPFARHVNAWPGPRIELQIVEPAENTLPSKMQKFCTSAPVIWTVVVCAMPGAGIAIIIPDNTTTMAFLSIEALNVLSSGIIQATRIGNYERSGGIWKNLFGGGARLALDRAL